MMASNGSVVAESKREPDKSCTRNPRGPAPVAPKPEVARKPQLPSTKPNCPPVPKKPPVAHKPSSLSAPSPSPPTHHGTSPASSCLPVLSPSPTTRRSPSRTDASGACTPPATAAALSPSAPSGGSLPTQGAASGAVSPGTASKPVGKTPPPPLPKNPPKAASIPGKRPAKEPPPRPIPLAVVKKLPPPVPAKKPASKPRVVWQNVDQGSSHPTEEAPPTQQREPSLSYQQVVVRESTEAQAEVRESESCAIPSSENETASAPEASSYQQVVVQDHFSACAKGNLDLSGSEKDSSSPHNQSFENELQERLQNLPSSDPLHSYEQVIVEENAQSDLNGGVNAVCKREEPDQKLEESEDSVKQIHSDSGGHEQSLLPSDPEHSTKTPVSEDQVGLGQATERGTKHVASEGSESLSPSSGEQCVREGEKESQRVAENCDPVVRKSPRRPPRPSFLPPPPVRPKPKKRISLLRQSEVADEDGVQEIPSSTDKTDSSSSPQNWTPSADTTDHSVEEAVYQEIDELQPRSETVSERKTPSRCAVDKIPDAEVIKSEQPGKDVDLCQESCSGVKTEQSVASTNNTDVDNVQIVCPEHSKSTVVEVTDDIQPAADSIGTNSEGSPQESETASHPTDKSAENTDPKNTPEVSQKSPEKRESVTLEDVGETSFMLKEIEQLLKVRLATVNTEEKTEASSTRASKVLPTSQSLDCPVRPPRPKRADRLRKLTVGSCSADNSSTESLTSVGLPGKKAPPKPKRKSLPGFVNRSLSDVTGMKIYVDQLNGKEDEEEDKPFLPPRQESLRISPGATPPPLPPRNKSMEPAAEVKVPQDPKPTAKEDSVKKEERPSSVKKEEQPSSVKKEEQPSSAVDRRASTPNFETARPISVARSSSGAKCGKKHMPRPTRKAPPPPPHAPNRPLSMSAAQDALSSKEPPSSAKEKTPGYQKISNGLMAVGEDINTVVPKIAVLGNINSPSKAEVTTNNDYHEIPDYLVTDLCEQTEEPDPDTSKDVTPPPNLPPRGYNPPPQPSVKTPSEPNPSLVVSDSSKAMVLSDSSKAVVLSDSSKAASSDKKRSSSDADSNTEASLKGEDSSLCGDESEGASQAPLHLHRLSGHLSAEDSTSQSSQRSSRPESFSSEVLGSLAHVVGEHHRPVSAHSGSSPSETGSGEVEVPTFDHSSGSESENEDDEERKNQKREKKVYYIAEEVVKSEKVFVDVLRLLNVDFRVFMSSKTEQAGQAIVPAEALNKILDFLPQLQSFNEMLLKDLTDRIANWDKLKKIADIFVKKGPFLKLYSSYIRNFEHATALLDEACKKHNGFGMALQQFEMSPQCANLALKHYMLKPIQRIPQYKLLLQDYLKHLTPDCPDYKDTITALSIVSEVADHANESMRHGDNVQKLLEIQRSLIGQFEVIQPGRVLIRKGELMKMSRKEMQPRMFFLFSDVLLYTTPTATGYRLNNILPLQGMKVLPPKLEEFSNEFNIITTQRSFTVATSTSEEREAWLRALWNAIEENSERYHTFKAMRSEPKMSLLDKDFVLGTKAPTSLLDKDFVLGTKAPLWVPDARVTMCMLCLAEFSITWRRHHCRACGRIICGNCSENKAPLRYLLYKPHRVCDECFEKLANEVEEHLEKEKKKSEGDKSASSARPSSSSSSMATTSASSSLSSSSPAVVASSSSSDALGLSLSSIKARFQKIRKSARERRKGGGLARPSVLKEVHANDEGSDMSGYLWVAKNKKWKRLWFVVKGKVLYTYKASEDMAAIESMPLLGFEVTRMTSWYQGAEPDLMFELHHQNTQPLVFKPRNPSSSSSIASGGDRISMTPSEDDQPLSRSSLSPHVKSSVDTTTPRLIFRTDSAAATTK
ncbi:hypothetical protein ACOMHN_027941 [Nucella lapillus]